jgi:hypothetical protein
MRSSRADRVFACAGIVREKSRLVRHGRVLGGLLACALALPQATSAWGASEDSHRHGARSSAKPDLTTAKKHYVDGRTKFEATPAYPPQAAPSDTPVYADPLAPASVESEPPQSASAPASRLPVYLTAGAAIISAGVGTMFGVMALSDKVTFDRNSTTQNASTRDTHALIADVSFGAALSLAALSAVLFFTSSTQPAESESASTPSSPKVGRSPAHEAITVVPTPFVGPHAGGAGLLLRF